MSNRTLRSNTRYLETNPFALYPAPDLFDTLEDLDVEPTNVDPVTTATTQTATPPTSTIRRQPITPPPPPPPRSTTMPMYNDDIDDATLMKLLDVMKLEGDKNYTMWKFRIGMALKAAMLFDHTTTEPPQGTTDEDKMARHQATLIYTSTLR